MQKPMDYVEFEAFYRKHGICPGQVSKPKNPLSDVQLESRYQKYKKSIDKQNYKILSKQNEKGKFIEDEKWELIRIEVLKRDNKQCQLLNKLSYEETHMMLQASGLWIMEKIDCAHIFGKGSYPHMKYDTENVVALNRYSHGNLDRFLDPIDGHTIDSEQVEGWWRFIIGDDRYERLKRKAIMKKE